MTTALRYTLCNHLGKKLLHFHYDIHCADYLKSDLIICLFLDIILDSEFQVIFLGYF